MHDVPALHGTHVPLPLHTPPVHGLPAALLPVSLHTDDPVEHEVVPVLQEFAGEQVSPAVQETQTPPEQTRLVPHEVPLPRAVVLSTQTGTPLEHESFPEWHAFAGVHGCPSLQGAHTPALHTMPFPHGVPGALLPFSAQTCDPVAHEFAPVLQTLAGWHAPPAVHETHCPVRHTRLVPQMAPSESDTLLSAQVGVPVEHPSVPV